MIKLGSLLAIFVFATVVPSQAALQLAYQINGGTVTVCNSGADTGPVICPSINSGAVTVSVFDGLSNSPGTPSNANMFADELNIVNTGTTSATVILWASAQDFTAPHTPPAIEWTNNSSTDGTAGSWSGEAVDCVSPTNILQPGGVTTTTPTYCTGGTTLAGSVLAASGPAGHASASTNMLISNLTTTFSLSTQITLTLSAGANFHFQDSQVLTAVPEPSAVMLLGSVLLGIGLTLRKRVRQG